MSGVSKIVGGVDAVPGEFPWQVSYSGPLCCTVHHMDTLDSTEFHRVRLRFSAFQDRVLLNSTLLSIEFNLTQRSVQDNALYRSGQRCPGQVQFDSALSRTEFSLTRRCPGQSSV